MLTSSHYSMFSKIFLAFAATIGASNAFASDKVPQQAFFGDTHLHTSLSGDARGYGLTLSPEEGFRIAKGESVKSMSGRMVKLRKPLDFMVVADHAEGYGMMDELIKGNPVLMKNATARRWHDMITKGPKTAYLAVREIVTAQGTGKLPKELIDNPKLTQPIWDKYLDTAERHNEPGKFTALIGYEWTAMRKGNNLHRVVIFRDDAETVKQTLPVDSNKTAHDPLQLWQAMAAYEKNTGGQVLAIPHNSNLSGGMMFDYNQVDGKPIDKNYAKLLQRWEPLLEVSQTKGDSETHPYLSPNDEFADYETWEVANLAMTQVIKPEMLAGSYARSGYKRGLEMEQKLGVNPYKFGLIASSDSHNAIPVTEEDVFFGKNAQMEPSNKRWKKPASQSVDKTLINEGWTMSASGLAAVWATENTREALFDAMKRKETFATTGSRISVRLFASWKFPQGILKNSDWINQAYEAGVPMGGTLSSEKKTATPSFVLAASKDPQGANLDRIQIVKGWIDEEGQSQEKVFDVVWSGDRKINKDGKLPSVGNTVDIKKASYSNDIGTEQLMVLWKDDEYQAGQNAFYYARVLEIPTPRWTAYDAKEFKLDLPEKVKLTTVERAYTSPIWVN